MRILASNPDTLGDMVLRQPMYRALADAGHELLLVVRPGVEPLVRHVAPAAQTLLLPAEVYAGDDADHWARFDATFRAAADFAPDALLVAPYRWTLFEEKLSAALPGSVKRIGMSGHLYGGDPHAGPSPVSSLRFDVVAEVSEDQAEAEKNAALCAAVLGEPPRSCDPRLQATEASLESARQTLGCLGLEPGGYWVACVGGTAHVSIKTWPPGNWGQVFANWTSRFDRRFLFVGLPEERPAAEAVLAAMGPDAGRHAAVWMEPASTLDDLLALTQLSAGYVGHDTGPMHVAAAMGKPTVAVFGGGTWPRFRPAVEPSVAVTVGVPCIGCGWMCSFSTSHCIKRVPVDAVWQAVLDLEDGLIKGREARVLEPGRELRDLMIREAAVYVRDQVREKATLAGHLREMEDAVAAGDGPGWASGVRSELHAAREEAHRATEAAERRAAETAQLRQDLELRASESQRLAGLLEAQTQEVNRLREEIRGILRDVEKAGSDGSHAADGVLPAAPRGATDSPARAAEQARDDEIERLRSAVERLDARVRELEPRVRPVRRPMRQVLTDWVIGSKYHPRRPPLQFPRVVVVTPVLNAAATIRATVESVLAQHYHHLRYVVVDGGSTDGTAEILREYEDRIDRVLTDDRAGPMEAAARAFEQVEGDVLHVLESGDVLESGGVMRVAEFFARHRGVNAVYAEDAVDYGGGWKFPAPPQPTADVYHLLRLAAEGKRFANGVFFRRGAYLALGPLKTELGRAADWDLWARLARRFELRRIAGHVRTIPARRVASADPAYAADLARARQAFEQTFGTAGRLRCRALELSHRAFDALRKVSPFPRLSVPFHGRADAAKPPAEAPPRAPGQPVCPLTDRPPDRLLFSTRDTTGGEGGVHHVYYDSDSGAALASPPVPQERLEAMYARRASAATQVTPPEQPCRSPYAGFRGGVLGSLVQKLPSPYWLLRRPQFHDVTGEESLAVLRGLLDPADQRVRLLNVGCFDGGVLDCFKANTRWKLAGTESNPEAAAAARVKGHDVWDVAPHEAAMALPVGELFDVIVLANTVEHLPNPLLVLRRLRQLLRPGGLLVLNQPNLDSAHVKIFGPTWGHWQAPYHRVLTGRRGLKRMAQLADFRVVRLCTRTLPYPACVSVQLNELGLGATVPDSARFPDSVAARGMRLTAWSRLLWDWRGRGDFLFAVLRSE
jgi:ADP-heptose:LPS heptosyltransferase/SAM-dependent methyltransferase